MGTQSRAVVLHDGSTDRPDEADTIEQADAIAGAFGRLGWDVAILPLQGDVTGLEQLLRPRPDIVFNLVEAIGGDGSLSHVVPELLDRFGQAYTGTSSLALRQSNDKPLAKQIMRSAGLPTPRSNPAEGSGSSSLWIVKPAQEDASLGIDAGSVVPAARVAEEIAARSARFGGAWFAEAYIEGREFNVGLLEGPDGLTILPIAEIEFIDYPADRPRIVDYEAKWLQDSFAYHHTPRRFLNGMEDVALLGALGDLADRAFRLFGLRGYARVDFRVDAAGRPWILEVNANPCLTADAGFMAAAGQACLSLDDVVARIVNAASPDLIRAVA